MTTIYTQQFREQQVDIESEIFDAGLLQTTTGFLNEIFQPGHSAGFLFGQLSEVVCFNKAVDNIVKVAFDNLSQTIEGQADPMVG